MEVFIPWATMKTGITNKARLRYVEKDTFYALYYRDDIGEINSEVLKDAGANQTEFEASYKPYANVPYNDPANIDGRKIVHSTPRKRGLFTCFTGAGDDQADHSKIGGAGGQVMAHTHLVGAAVSETIYVDFNSIANETHAHAGWMQWKDALNDRVTMESVPKLSTYVAGTNTYFNIYAGYLVVPAAGTGTADVTSQVLVEVPINEYGNRSGGGYWDATYNTTTKVFEGLTANPYGTGRYNMFVVEVVLDRFINRVSLLGEGALPLDTYDASQLGHGMRLKMTLETVGTDHQWYWNGMIKPYRKKTV